MFKKINLQFLLSYLGLFPFLIILLDKLLLQYFKPNIVKDFSVLYSLIIYVFIGAVNWNLRKNVSTKLIFLGFIPSFISIFIIIMFLFSFEVFHYLIIFFILQLILDNFYYKGKFERNIYFKLRIPLTFFLVMCLIFIQLLF